MLIPVDWAKGLSDFLIRTVDLFLKYHVQGNLEKIELDVSVSLGDAEITLTIDGNSHEVDFDVYKMAEEDCERDAQRECYFENESCWVEFFEDMGEDEERITSEMKTVAEALKTKYHVPVEMEVDMEEY